MSGVTSINSMNAAVVIGICSGIGIVGVIGESFAKDISKRNHPRLRTIGEVFCKFIQIIPPAAALALALADRGMHNKVLTPLFCVIMLTPFVNGIASHTRHEKFKNRMNKVDLGLSATAKALNTIAFTVAVVARFQRYGLIMGAITGLSLSTLSVKTFLKA